ncbi:MAG: DUF4160 domain-containing protein [Bauldia sp.]|nr:DUF4160 domain-containing protein [Bauldia sp.]
MPTVLRLGAYRLFFYSADGDEPPHVHVERDDSVAKFCIDPVRLDSSGGFRRAELRDIERLVYGNQAARLEAWHGFFAG